MVATTLAAYLLGLMFMLLVPWGDVPSWSLDHLARVAAHLGAPDVLLGPTRVEFGANVLVIVPVVVAAAWLLPRVRWSEWTAYGFIASLGVEAVQALVLSGRLATFSDVVANTTGALIGAVIGSALHQRFRPLGVPDRRDTSR